MASITSTIDDLLASSKQQDAKYEKSIAPIAEDMRATNAPKIPTMPEAPKPPEQNTMQDFGSAAMWVAAFGSLLTKRPVTTALHAASGVMNAYHQKDADTFNQQYELWKENTAHTIDLHKMEQDYYNDVLNKDEKMAGIYATMFKNDTALKMAQVKMSDEYIKQMNKMAKPLTESQQKWGLIDERAQKYVDEDGMSMEDARMKAFGEVMRLERPSQDARITKEDQKNKDKLTAYDDLLEDIDTAMALSATPGSSGLPSGGTLSASANKVMDAAKRATGQSFSSPQAAYDALISKIKQEAVQTFAGGKKLGKDERENIYKMIPEGMFTTDASQRGGLGVLREEVMRRRKEAGASAGGGGGGEDIKYKPQTQEEYDKIPSGEIYIDPDDGKPYTKP